MQTWQTFGHSAVRNILEKQLEAQKFAHAYLFCGPSDIGKRFLAHEFASKLLGTQRLEAHPDFQVLDAAGDVSAEQVRDFVSKMNYTPMLGKWKVAVIDHAESLNVQGSNALLKTLEEPPESSILILVSSSAVILPTVVSRCQTFSFNAFTLDQLREYARQAGLEASEEALSLSAGSVSRLRSLVENSKAFERQLQQLRQLAEIPGLPVQERLLAVPELAELENEELKDLLSKWLYAEKSGLARNPVRAKVLGAILQALGDLRTNKNKKLILQGLFLKV